MTTKPILFSGPMVRAILDGRKTQTRRVLNPQPWDGCDCGSLYVTQDDEVARIPYSRGDTLWVREAFGWELGNPARVHYRADPPEYTSVTLCPKPSIHMPRWASRLTLDVTDVRVERVQDISEEDARAEGAYACDGGWSYGGSPLAGSSARGAFYCLWNSLNAARGFGWGANPWVVAVTFKPHMMNVDTYLAQKVAA